MSLEKQRVKVLLAGICGLSLMLGIARFAYTPMLPLLQEQTGLTEGQGAWLASINYLGYLSGAFIAAIISDMQLKDRLYRIGIFLAIITTMMMSITTDIYIWGLSRFLAGLSSAAGLMLGSGLVLNWLLRHKFHSELGIHFAGIGVGIFVTSFLVEISSSTFGWQDQWLGLTMFGLLLAIPAWFWLPRPVNAGVTISGDVLKDNLPSKIFLGVFMAAYFCAGVGYVISATFIVDIVNDFPGLAGKGSWIFMLIGLASAPACFVWDLIARRIGDLNALILASLLHIAGVMLPLLMHSLTMVSVSAVLFGVTFVGIVSLVLTMSGRYYPSRPAKMMGKMTFSYGVAQILAPAIIAVVADDMGGYTYGLYLATAAMMIGTVLLIVLKKIEDKSKLGEKYAVCKH